ncbi:MAG: hypothetical protein Q9M46_00560, partial [Ghiorsea sp.]|nr:hypothetical protein [Ghiorsea sp.]
LVDMKDKMYTKILGDLQLYEKIPPLRWPREKLGEISKEASKETGLPEGTYVMVGSCDINCEMLAADVVNCGDMLIVLGSTISVILIIDKYSYLEGFITSYGIYDGTYKIGGATSSGGRFLKWIERIFKIREIENAKDEGVSGIVMLRVIVRGTVYVPLPSMWRRSPYIFGSI